MKKVELENLVKKFKCGDNTAFNKIYNETYKLVYMVIYGIIKNKATAEDIMQDTYRAAIQYIDNYESSNFIAWLTRIGKNLALNKFNKNKKEAISEIDENINNNTYENNTEYGLFEKAKEILNEEDYNILIMIIVSGYKRREISDYLNIPISTVSHRYKQALVKLKKYIEEVK